MTNHHISSMTAVSAPGKVLLTGGYLVLDRGHTGTVFALDARIHVIVEQLRRGSRQLSTSPLEAIKDGPEQLAGSCEFAEANKEETIVVRSPQFRDAVWEYRLEGCDNNGGVKAVQRGTGLRNPFVETSLNYALTYISYVADSKEFGSLALTILADSDYYSAAAPSGGPDVESQGRFRNFGVPLHEAHKTGLGSSAALVTALVSGLVLHRTMHPGDLGLVRDKLHNLAQAAHCAAQGKVGSGFDVAAAIYGSCVYRRFSPSVLDKIGEVGSSGFEERLFFTVEDLDPTHQWDTECLDFGMRLPPGVQIVLCDVDCGSNTPSMVKQLLEWRKQNREEADLLWSNIQNNNDKLRLTMMRQVMSSNPNAVTLPPEEYEYIRAFIKQARSYLRIMTAKSGVPIEPRVQTELLDTLSGIEGVIGGLVPGAGGYDAVVLLIRDDVAVVERLNALFEDWKSSIEDDFGGKIEKVRLLGVRHESEGVRNEKLGQYVGWI